MNTVYLSLGSNLGDREGALHQAIERLNSHEFVDVEAVSDFRETDPMGADMHPKYINAAVKLSTILSPEELLALTQDIERHGGRTSKGTYDPREIDIDILLYGEQIVSTEDLTIPHALMHERTFVLEPMKEIAPDVGHPLLEKTMAELCDEVAGY